MKKMKRTVGVVAVVLVAVILATTVLVVGVMTPNTSENAKKGDPSRLTYDSSSDFGLYWYGGASGTDYVRSSENVGKRYFDPSKPTLIYFHGWNFSGENKEVYSPFVTSANTIKRLGCERVNYAKKFLDEGYNVGEFNWCAYAEDIMTIFSKLWVGFQGGEALAVRFAKEYGAFFGDYDGRVTFFGHSYGAQAAISTAYLLGKMYDEGTVENAECLPERFTFADPYIGDMTVYIGGKEDLSKKIGYLDEEINGRLPATLFADCLDYLTERGALCDIYCGMSMAYDSSFDGDVALHDEVYDRIYSDCSWTVLKGMQKAYGVVGDIHNMTEDWVKESFFVTKKIDTAVYPTAGLSNEELRSLIGKCFETQHEGLNLSEETFVEIIR